MTMSSLGVNADAARMAIVIAHVVLAVARAKPALATCRPEHRADSLPPGGLAKPRASTDPGA